MSHQLRERSYPTFEAMQRDVVSVEANLQAKRAGMRTERQVTFMEEASTSTSEAKNDSLVRTMERMMERTNINDSSVPRKNTPTQHNRNPNPRRNNPQIRERDQRGRDQQFRPPFQEYYANDTSVVEEVEESQINLMGTNEDDFVFRRQEEYELFLLTQTELESGEYDDYKYGWNMMIINMILKMLY